MSCRMSWRLQRELQHELMPFSPLSPCGTRSAPERLRTSSPACAPASELSVCAPTHLRWLCACAPACALEQGVKMTKLTNSRGFAVELSAAAVVILGSRYDLPLS